MVRSQMVASWGDVGWGKPSMGTERAAIRAADFQSGCGHCKQGVGWVFLLV